MQAHLEAEQHIDEFLNSLNLPVLSEEQNQTLTAAVTKTGLNSAITRLKANKSPGPYGFLSKWYKVFLNRVDAKPPFRPVIQP